MKNFAFRTSKHETPMLHSKVRWPVFQKNGVFGRTLITSSQNVARLQNEATALRNRPEFSKGQLTELARSHFESWAKESFEIATKIAYQNGAVPGTPNGNRRDCSEVADAAILPAGYVKVAGRIADRRIVLAGYRLAEPVKSL